MELYVYSQYTFLCVLLIKNGLQCTDCAYIWLQNEVTKPAGDLSQERTLYSPMKNQTAVRKFQEQCTMVPATCPPAHLPHSSSKVHINVILRKVKWSRHRPGVAQRVGRGIAVLFHDRGARRGWVVSSTPRLHFTPRTNPVPNLQEAGWAPGPVWTGEKSRPTGIRSRKSSP